MIGGGPQKINGINSSSAFMHPSQMPPSLMGNNTQGMAPQPMGKVKSGTLSHKSLRSQSSQRKRVGSMGSNNGMAYDQNGSKYSIGMGHN